VGYGNDDRPDRRFSITTAGVASSCAACTQFALIDSTSFTVRYATEAVIGHEAGDPRMTVVQWRDKDYLITVRGDLDDDTMRSVAQIVAPARDRAVNLRAPTKLVGYGMPSDHRTLGSGMLGDGSPSTIAVGRNEKLEYIWGVGQPGGSMEPRATTTGPGASIETLVERGRTYVFAKASRTTVSPHLRVHRNGLPTAGMELTALDPAFPDVFTAYVFLEPVPFNAEIVDGDGQVIASWPTSTG
jgi:hypothetical protein